MNTKLQIETKVRRLIHYIQDIEKGLLQIPPFQRDKVWDNNKRKELFDSLKNGYPIGSILLWKPEENLFEKSINKIGPYTVDIDSAKDFFYILDGFQRLSTIFGCLINKEKTKLPIDEEEWRKEFYICYDLKEEEFIIPRGFTLEIHQIPVYQLIDTKAAFQFQQRLQKSNYTIQEIDIYAERYEKLGTLFIDYVLPSTEIIGGGVEDAVEIFSRVNSAGSIISPDWMVSALSYNKDQEGFRLGSEIDNLLENVKIYNFDSLKRDLIFQCIINSFGKVHFDQMAKHDTNKITKLVKRPDFVEKTRQTIESIQKAIQFLFEELLVVDSKLLPYGNQLIFITDFFNQTNQPTENQLKKLKEWFWITTYANYFTIYSLSKQREAYNQFQKFLQNENENPVYNDRPYSPFETVDFPNKIFFGSVRAKALLLFLLNYSNKFQRVEQLKMGADKVKGLHINYLFHDKKDEKGNFYPESVILLPMNVNLNKGIFSFLLKEYKKENAYEFIFLTKEMSEIFNRKESNYQTNILIKRKSLIIKAEKEFVEKLGLKYTDTWTPPF